MKAKLQEQNEMYLMRSQAKKICSLPEQKAQVR